MLNGIFWRVSCRVVPERYGSWKTIYKRFMKCYKAGIFKKVFRSLATDEDMQDINTDSPCNRVYKASAGVKGEILAVITDWIEYYNKDRYQWNLARLSPQEYYQYEMTGVYPINGDTRKK